MRPVLKNTQTGFFFKMHKDGSDAGIMYEFFTHTHTFYNREK